MQTDQKTDHATFVPYGDRGCLQDSMFAAKHAKRLTFGEIAKELNRSEVRMLWKCFLFWFHAKTMRIR